jgi:hypothetical protein
MDANWNPYRPSQKIDLSTNYQISEMNDIRV